MRLFGKVSVPSCKIHITQVGEKFAYVITEGETVLDAGFRFSSFESARSAAVKAKANELFQWEVVV